MEHTTPEGEPNKQVEIKRSATANVKGIRKITALFKSMDFMKKYLFDFFVIFISISSASYMAKWQTSKLHRFETVKALEAVSQDLKIDTTNYNKIIPKLMELEPILLEAMNGSIEPTEVKKLQGVLTGLRAYHGRGVQKYGYHYLSQNITNPTIYTKGLLHWIGLYHELSSPDGNFGGFNRDYYEITFENHKNLFLVFPNYLHPDSTVAEQAILNGAEAFLSDPYWKARVGLTFRQVTSYNRPVYINNKNLAVKIIEMIEREIEGEL